jgi:predicted nucleic acid-binding protein
VTTALIVLDASAIVDYLTGGRYATWIREQLSARTPCGPAHLKAEVFSALGRQYRSGIATEDAVADALREVAALDVQTHPVEGLLAGAWQRRHNLSLADALYVELAAQLGTVVVTTDQRLGRATPLAVAPPG